MASGSRALIEQDFSGPEERGAFEGDFAERLAEAIRRDELFLLFQPQADTETGRVTGVEALARWRLPDGTVVPPDVFIPLAESTGTIGTLGDWVMRRAAATAAGWMRAGVGDLSMAVNLSARQLDEPGLARSVLGILAETGLPAANLKLELTETTLFTHGDSARQSLVELRGAGVRLVLDDFGTGYSSLALLRTIPVEAVKIDKRFVQDMLADRDAAAIVHAVIALSHALGLEAIAEGVETHEQWLFLRAYRCDRVQGFHLSKPLDAAKVPGFIARRDEPPTAR